jgi:hypothetical protein
MTITPVENSVPYPLLRNSLEKRAWRYLFLLCPLNKALYRVVSN